MAIAIGFVLGLACFAILFWRGLLVDSGAAAVALVAIASYWLVFALMDGGTTQVLSHGTVAAIFALVAIIAAPAGKIIIALAIIGHGVFDVLHLHILTPVGPTWWSGFCAALDVALGAALLMFWWQDKKIQVLKT